MTARARTALAAVAHHAATTHRLTLTGTGDALTAELGPGVTVTVTAHTPDVGPVTFTITRTTPPVTATTTDPAMAAAIAATMAT